MRISDQESEQLKNSILAIDKTAKVYLFGSRADKNKRGGDIDILILTHTRINFEDLSKIRWEFYERFGEQKLDLVNFCFTDNDQFKNIALKTAQEL